MAIQIEMTHPRGGRIFTSEHNVATMENRGWKVKKEKRKYTKKVDYATNYETKSPDFGQLKEK